MSKSAPRPFSDSDAESARRIYAERGGPPSGAPATAIFQSPSASAWRHRPEGNAFDVYVSEFAVPVKVESFVAMTSDPEGRKTWDTNLKALHVLATSPPAELCHLHRQAGDAMTLFWSVSCPFPIKDRDYVLSRALRKLPPCADGQPSLYCVADRAVDEVSTYLLQPRTGSRVNRVCTYHQFNVAWAESPSSTRVRSEYSEDPMMPLPSWLLTYVTTKALPAGIEGLKKNAANFDERLQSQPAALEASSERRSSHQRSSSKDLGHRRTGSKERLERRASKEGRALRQRKTSKELHIGLSRGSSGDSKARLGLNMPPGETLGAAETEEETPSESTSNHTSADGVASAPPTPKLDATPPGAPLPADWAAPAPPPPPARSPRPKIREVLARRTRRGSARSVDASQLEVIGVVAVEAPCRMGGTMASHRW